MPDASSANPNVEPHVFSIPFDCHYLVSAPEDPHPSVLFLALHGYGMNARTMLQLTRLLLGPNRLIVSLQAPHQFYLNQPPTTQAGYNWGIREHGAANIRLHHDMVRAVRRIQEERFRIPASRTVIIGFSQPVGFNYRFAATHPRETGGVIGICGGVPKDWESGSYGQIFAPLLHIARQEDEFFPEEVTLDYERKLRTRAHDVEYHLLPGGHRFPSKAGPLVDLWLRRVFPD